MGSILQIEMYKDGDLKDLDNHQVNASNVVWFWQKVRKGFFGKNQEIYMNADVNMRSRFVVTNLVHVT